MIKHLKRYTSISVRERSSFDYLQSIGVNCVTQVFDPAFAMDASINSDCLQLQRDNTLGLNLSWLVRNKDRDQNSRIEFDESVFNFMRKAVEKLGFNIILIPHVDSLSGQYETSDRGYLGTLLRRPDALPAGVSIAPERLNAVETKGLIGQCRFFIGARTHATIAAISQCIPTISLGYSIKSYGINMDMFGHTDYVIPSTEVTAERLFHSVEKLIDNERQY